MNGEQYNPTEKDALLLLADIRRRQGNLAEGISLLKQAVLETKHAPTAWSMWDSTAMRFTFTVSCRHHPIRRATCGSRPP